MPHKKKIIHGSLVSICQKGVLLLGPSGSGKSECVVDLIKLGHRFIADDAVGIHSAREKLIGRPCSTSFPLCIRGVGIVDVEKLYGHEATCPQTTIDVVVVFKQGESAGDYELIGEEEKSYRLLGKNIRCLELPQKTHGRMAHLVELGVKHLTQP